MQEDARCLSTYFVKPVSAVSWSKYEKFNPHYKKDGRCVHFPVMHTVAKPAHQFGCAMQI